METPRWISAWRRRAVRRWRGFRDDARGTSAVEAALILPSALLMLALLIYGAEGFAINRKVSMTARTVTDLVTQATPTQYSNGSSVMTEAAIDNLLQVASSVLTPYSASNMTMVVSQVLVGASGTTAHGHLERALQRRDGESRRPGSHPAGHHRNRPGRQLLRLRRSLLQLHPAEFLHVAEPDHAVRLDLSHPASVGEHHLLELRDALDRAQQLKHVAIGSKHAIRLRAAPSPRARGEGWDEGPGDKPQQSGKSPGPSPPPSPRALWYAHISARIGKSPGPSPCLSPQAGRGEMRRRRAPLPVFTGRGRVRGLAIGRKRRRDVCIPSTARGERRIAASSE